MAFALTLAGVEPSGQGGLRKPKLLQELPLRGLAGPQVGAVGRGGIHHGANRLWWQLNLLFHRCQLFIKLGDTRGGLLFLAGHATKLSQQRLPAFIVVVDDKRWGDGRELVVQRQRRITAGSAYQDQIRHLCGNRFGARFADIQPGEFTRFCHIAPLAQKSLAVGDAVIRRGGSAGNHRRINRQQGAGEGDAGGDDAGWFLFQRMDAVAVGYLTRPVSGMS